MTEPVLEFDQHGFLIPYAPILATLDTVERVFVEEFPNSTTRRANFERYKEYNARLLALIPAHERPDGLTQWIDGSFVSRKQNPQDIDVLTFIDATLYKYHEQAIRALGTEFRTGRARVDTYPIQVFAEGHIYRNRYESDYIEWLHTWTYTDTRPRKQKGFIEILIG